jgi:hypothetical protein
VKGEEKPSIENKDGNPSIKKYKAKESTSKHNPKKKQKQIIFKKQKTNPMQIGSMATK